MAHREYAAPRENILSPEYFLWVDRVWVKHADHVLFTFRSYVAAAHFPIAVRNSVGRQLIRGFEDWEPKPDMSRPTIRVYRVASMDFYCLQSVWNRRAS